MVWSKQCPWCGASHDDVTLECACGADLRKVVPGLHRAETKKTGTSRIGFSILVISLLMPWIYVDCDFRSRTAFGYDIAKMNVLVMIAFGFSIVGLMASWNAFSKHSSKIKKISAVLAPSFLVAGIGAIIVHLESAPFFRSYDHVVRVLFSWIKKQPLNSVGLYSFATGSVMVIVDSFTSVSGMDDETLREKLEIAKRERIVSLLRKLREPHRSKRLTAARELGAMGRAAAVALPRLEELAVNDGDDLVQEAARKSVEQIKGSAG